MSKCFDMLNDLRQLQHIVLSETTLPQIERRQIAEKIDALFEKDTVPEDYAEILSLIAHFPSFLALSSMKDQTKFGTSFNDVHRGYHLIRSYLAHIAHAKRKEFSTSKQWSRKFDKDGYLYIDHFMSKKYHELILDEIQKSPW